MLFSAGQAFTRNFDLIAERKSVIFHLRELAKAQPAQPAQPQGPQPGAGTHSAVSLGAMITVRAVM